MSSKYALSGAFVSLIVPLHDDAEILGTFLERAVECLRTGFADYEIILVDDGSHDRTPEVVSDAIDRDDCIRVIRFPRPFGEEAAIAAGMESAIGDFVAVCLPSDPPDLVPEAVELCQKGAELVVGALRIQPEVSLRARLGDALSVWYCKRFLDVTLPLYQTQFRVLSRKVVASLLQIRERKRYLRFSSLSLGYSHRVLTYTPLACPESAHVPYSLRYFLGFIVSQSLHPLRLVTWAGVAASVLDVLYSCYVVATYLFHPGVAKGWTTLSMQVSVMFFFVFLILAVACEYLGQVLMELKDRPLYHVLEERNSSVMLANPARPNLVGESAPLPRAS